MKCRHGHRWIEDRCVMGWCKQDKEGVDVVGVGFTWAGERNLAVPDQVESENWMIAVDFEYLRVMEILSICGLWRRR